MNKPIVNINGICPFPSKLRQLVIGAFIILLSVYSCYAQYYYFTNIDQRDGLPMDHVTHIIQDSLGYMWFGGHNGVARYNSHDFDIYNAIPGDTTSLTGNNISELYASIDGQIWVSTHEGGLNRYDPVTGHFEQHYYYPKTTEDLKIMPIHCLYIDTLGQVWIGSQFQGLGLLVNHNRNVKFSTKNQHKWHAIDIIPDPRYRDSILVSSGYQLRICSIESGDCRIIRECDSDQGIWNNMVVDSHGVLWSARYFDGLSSYELTTHKVRHYLQPNSENTNIILDDKGRIWMGTHGLGLKIFDPETSLWSTILPTGAPGSILSNYIESLYKSRDGTIWVGTDKGVSYLDPDDQFAHPYKVNEPGTDKGFFVHSYSAVGPMLGSAYYPHPIIFSKESKSYKDVPFFDGSEDLERTTRMVSSGDELFIFFRNGIGALDNKSKHIYRYKKGKYHEEIAKRGYCSVTKTNKDQILFTKPPNILFLLDPEKGVIDSFHIGVEQKATTFSRSIFYQNEHAVWMEMDAHLVKYDMEKRALYVFSEEPLSGYFSNGINDILVDNEGVVWVATWQDGLFALEEKAGKLSIKKRYSTLDGLANNRISQLVCSKQGTVFASSTTGLSVFDPELNRFLTYTRNNGLLDNHIISMTIEGDSLFLGHEMGYSSISLGAFNNFRKPVKPSVIRFAAGNTNAFQYKDQSSGMIKIPYQKNDVSIRFNAIDFSNPKATKYMYKLEGFHDWKKANYNENTASYPNLPPGEYRFLVKSKNDAEQWSDPVDISFEIIPPYWQRWWFILLLGLLLGTVIYLILSWGVKQIKAKQALIYEYDKQIANLELKALRSQMNPHFMFNSLNSIKSYILRHDPYKAAEYLSNFSHLIRMILQNSREKLIPLSKEIEMLKLYMELEKLRFRDSFDVHCDIDENIELDLIQIPPMILQPHIENAIWHGLLHKEGERRLDIRFKLKDGWIQCEIEDNGIGRKNAEIIKSKSATRYKSMGMGITNDRIALINSMNLMGIRTEIIDKMDENNHPLGTLVKIIIPYEYDINR